MKYVILIHSSPQPWGHPTSDFVAEAQARPAEQRERLGAEFDTMLASMQEAGELVGGQPLGDPRSSRLYRWSGDERVVTDGPYAEGEEHLAGFFVVDVASEERAREVAAAFSGPGETVELRPVASM